MSARHILIRGADGRLRVVDEYTGVSAGVLAADALPQPSGVAFVWSRFALWFGLGIAGGYMLARLIP